MAKIIQPQNVEQETFQYLSKEYLCTTPLVDIFKSTDKLQEIRETFKVEKNLKDFADGKEHLQDWISDVDKIFTPSYTGDILNGEPGYTKAIQLGYKIAKRYPKTDYDNIKENLYNLSTEMLDKNIDLGLPKQDIIHKVFSPITGYSKEDFKSKYRFVVSEIMELIFAGMGIYYYRLELKELLENLKKSKKEKVKEETQLDFKNEELREKALRSLIKDECIDSVSHNWINKTSKLITAVACVHSLLHKGYLNTTTIPNKKDIQSFIEKTFHLEISTRTAEKTPPIEKRKKFDSIL